MATVAALLAALLSGINIGLGLHGIWKRWQSRATPIPPHPLESALRDVALAIRERQQGDAMKVTLATAVRLLEALTVNLAELRVELETLKRRVAALEAARRPLDAIGKQLPR